MYRESEFEIKPAAVPTKHPCLPKWRSRVAAAREREHFTVQDRMDANNWNTCAVGEGYGRGFAKNCRDPILEALGLQFGMDVIRGSFDSADATLAKIEAALRGEVVWLDVHFQTKGHTPECECPRCVPGKYNHDGR